MANQNVMANAWNTHRTGGNWSYWTAVNSQNWELDFSTRDILAERFSVGTMRITRFTVTAYVKTLGDVQITDVKLIATLYRDDPTNGATPIATSQKSNYKTGDITFDFTGLQIDTNGGSLFVTYETDSIEPASNRVGFVFPSMASITYTSVPALTPSFVLPTGTQNGAQEIIFTWQTNSGVGTQTKAELQWSTDGVTWNALTTVGTAQSYTAPAATFPAGTIYARIRTTSSYGVVSQWVQRNFTVQYAAASVTLTTPTSGSHDGGEQITFAWTITAGGGSTNGTQMEMSFDDGLTWTSVVDSNASVTRYTAAAGSLPAGGLIWRVRARDSYAGWSVYKQASITIAYSAVSQVIPVNSPTSGIYNAASNRTFTVALQANGIVHEPFAVASAAMYWRSGESGNFTEVAMTPNGNQASVTITAGTIPSGIFQWYAEATDNTGRTTQTETFTLTALNAAVEATPLSPINTLESGSGPITFVWTYGSIDGSPQGKAEIRYSTDGGTNWTTLPEISGDVTRAVISAGTFSAGTITWQVRAYNESLVAGPWSDSVSFISFSAPIVTGVLGDGKPFLTVSWQVDTQQAYEVEVGGKTYGPYYGENVRSFTLSEPLPDGSYTVRVRTQNRYGLWSEWAEGNTDVTNVPGAVVPISANDGENVSLGLGFSRLAPIITEQPQDLQTTDTSAPVRIRCGIFPQPFQAFQWQVEKRRPPQTQWTSFTSDSTAPLNTRTLTLRLREDRLETYDGLELRFHIWPQGDPSMGVYSRTFTFTYAEPTQRSPLITGYFPAEYGYFLIYRDGELIGKTYQTPFADRTALGTHEYYAIQVLADGYYTRSAPYPVTGTASVKCPMIAPLEGGEFIPLRLSENSRRALSFSHHRQVAFTQYAGAAFPAAEIGENETLTASFDVAYLQTDKAAADAFENLLGQEVILKNPGGQVVVGVLEGYDINDMRFYKAYRCTLQQMDWGDFVDASKII